MSKASPLEAIKIAESLLPSQIANAELYNTLALNYQRAGNKNQYERFNALGMQLMAPAVAGNDGKSPRTAFDVISDREMFYILTAKSLPYHGSAILGVDKTSEGGHKYHKWRIRDPKTGQTVAMYFNVDLFQPKSTAAK